MPKLEIKRLDVKLLQPRKIYAFFGRRGSGKTVLALDIFGRLPLDFGIACSPTTSTISDLHQLMPKACVFQDGINQEQLMRFNDCTSGMVANGKIREFGLFADDCGYDSKQFGGKPMRMIAQNGRHQHITACWTFQYVTSLVPSVRAQCDWVFISKNAIRDDQVKLFKAFGGILGSFPVFQKVLESCTSNYSALVINASSPSMNISDCVFYYKAEWGKPKARMFRPIFWKLSDMVERGTYKTPAGIKSQKPVHTKQDEENLVIEKVE
jgi:hypothetical protein